MTEKSKTTFDISKCALLKSDFHPYTVPVYLSRFPCPLYRVHVLTMNLNTKKCITFNLVFSFGHFLTQIRSPDVDACVSSSKKRERKKGKSANKREFFLLAKTKRSRHRDRRSLDVLPQKYLCKWTEDNPPVKRKIHNVRLSISHVIIERATHSEEREKRNAGDSLKDIASVLVQRRTIDCRKGAKTLNGVR